MATLKGIGFVKRLWHEKPDIAGSLCVLFAGSMAVVLYGFRYDRLTYHQHRIEYTVIRKEEASSEGLKKGVYN